METTTNNAMSRIPALRSEALRLATFQGWPLDFIRPSVLAAAGFFYRGTDDIVQCAFCRIMISNWIQEDDPVTEHRQHSPTCPFINQLEIENIPIIENNISAPTPAVETTYRVRHVQPLPYLMSFENEIRPNARPERDPGQQTLTIREPLDKEAGPYIHQNNLGILQHVKARNPELSSFVSRYNTFTDWPLSLNQKPEQLAEAGFYYMKTGDHVKCFCCNGALRNWAPSDEPWVEHARWFSRCSFVNYVKGADYIKTVQNDFQENTENTENIDTQIKTETTETTTSIKKETDTNNDVLLCKICYDQQLSMVFLPCGHSMCCPSCTTALSECPLCRKNIDATVRVYFNFE